MRRGVLLTVAVAILPLAASAQSRPFIGGPPEAGQIRRARIVREVDVVLRPVDGDVPGFPAGGLRTVDRSVMVMRQETSSGAAGQLRLVQTYEVVEQTIELDGQALPIPESALEAIRGKVVTLTIGPRGEVLDTEAPPDFPIPAEQLQDLLSPIAASMPHQQMAVGEVVSLPMAIPLPLDASGGKPPLLLGRNKTRLTRVVMEGNDQVATLTHGIEVALEGINDTNPSRPVRVKVHMAGTGTTETFVRGGLVKTATMKATMTGQFERLDGAAGRVKLTGVVRTVVDMLPAE